MKDIKFCVYVLVLLIPVLSIAQNQIPLVDYLNRIENEKSVRFNYLQQDVKTLEITTTNTNQALQNIFNQISTQLPISFEWIDNTNIVVKRLSQFYCLKVLSENLNQALSNVYVESHENIIKTYQNGTVFFTNKPKSKTLKLFKDGYAVEEIEVESLQPNDCKIVKLTRQINLDEIQLIGYLTKGLNLNSDLSISLNPKEFEILAGLTQPDVLQTMQYVPGIVSLDERISNINVRGGTHDQNLFLWNGARLYQTGHFYGMISALNPSIAHQVNIYKNGSSAFYTEGLSSVVDISSAAKPLDQSEFELFANFLETAGKADIALSDHSQLRVAGRYAFSDIFDTPTFENYYDKIFQNTEISALSTNENLRLSSDVDLQYYDANLQFQTAFNDNTTWQINAMAISNELLFVEENINTQDQKDNYLTQESYVVSTQLDKNLSENVSLSSLAYLSYYKLEGENASVLNNQLLNQTNEVLDYGLKLRSDFELSEQYKFSLGYQFNEIGIRNDNIVNIPEVEIRQKSVLQTHAGIVEFKASNFDHKLKTTLGLRANYYDKFSEFKFEPHLNMSFAIIPSFDVVLMAEQKHQVTAQVIDLQNDFFGIEKRRWVLANENETPIQRLRQVEIGQVFNKSSWLLTANLFYKNVERITSASQNFQNQLEFLQLSGDYQTYGAEFLVQKQLQNFRLWLNYTYNDSEYEFDEFSPSVFPNNFETSHHAETGLSYTTTKVKLSLSGRFFTGRPTTPIDQDMPISNPDTNPDINFLDPNSDHITEYSQVNFTGSYTFLWSKFKAEIGLAILNLFNTNNTTNQFFRLSNDILEVERIENQGLEFTPNAFLKINF
ncbi:TonB-dependent receptor plug domain-containing protein [Mesohalobacter halotolerans]|uniref:TonB-dependent receptor n=1 Tax=Mesohalobacter halotolerans TaxID=1883405 RepID=A0A4U5TS09_9FLAO|nr:TonB-dependent receptor plug domain-containing protein [Mesohalobacter halotolerans]TKS56883.1 TonB-dependent receptor [Mesohalobacter halotolerans]